MTLLWILGGAILFTLASVFAVEVAILISFRRTAQARAEKDGEWERRLTSLEGRYADLTAALGKLATAVDRAAGLDRPQRTA